MANLYVTSLTKAVMHHRLFIFVHFYLALIVIFIYLHDLFKNDNQDPKQLQQPHGSHTVALSQVCPNNLNGGPVLT